MATPYYIGLLDCNNFFVSCERLFRPDLLGKPVVVLSGNDGCVVARSQEAKALGIPMGIPRFQVESVLREHRVTIFSSNFPLYRDISARVMAALSSCVDDIAVYSVDEAFFSISGHDPQEQAHAVKARVERWSGMPVSIGVSVSKTRAKLASEQAKLSGAGVCCSIDRQEWERAATEVPVGMLWGIGRNHTERLERAGIRTAAELMHAPRQQLRGLCGTHGLEMQDELHGECVRTLQRADALPKSIMSTRSFGRVTRARNVIDDAVGYHVVHAAERMRNAGCGAQSLTVLLYPRRHGSYAHRGGTRTLTLERPTIDTRVLLTHARMLVDALYETGVPYARAGVVLGDLSPQEAHTASLFTPEEPTVLMATLDALNRRFGRGTLRPASVRARHVWEPSADFRSQAYTTAWGDLPHVCA